MDPSLAMCSDFLLEIWNGTQLGEFGGVLVENWDNDVFGPSDGGLVRRQLKACYSVHPMGPGLGDVRIYVCAWLGG